MRRPSLLISCITHRIVTALRRVPWDTQVFQHIARCFHRRSRGEAAASVYRNVIAGFYACLRGSKEPLQEIGHDRAQTVLCVYPQDPFAVLNLGRGWPARAWDPYRTQDEEMVQTKRTGRVLIHPPALTTGIPWRRNTSWLRLSLPSRRSRRR